MKIKMRGIGKGVELTRDCFLLDLIHVHRGPERPPRQPRVPM